MPTPSDLDEFQSVLEDVQAKSSEAKALLQSLNNKVSQESFKTEHGLSFLELKNHLMLDYLSNLTFVMLKKCSGKSIRDDPAIERIVENRTVLEKMRPIEKKLKYQIDKTLKIAESGQISQDDPLNFKPNLSALKDNIEENDSNEEDSEDETETKEVKSKNGKYVPPKNVPAFMEDAESLEQSEQDKVKKRNLSKSILEDLRRQHMDTPEEEHTHVDTMKSQQIAQMKERIRYEEENFTRLPVSKKDKHRRRQMTTIGNLGDELTNFGSSYFNQDQKKGGKKRPSGGRHSGKFSKKFKKK